MKFIKFYILVSLAVGIMQFIEGGLLFLNGISPITIITTLVEFLWVLVTIVAIFKFSKHNVSKIMPASFIIYNVLGWSYGAYLVSTVENIEEFNPAQSLYLIGVVFGIFFAVFSAYLYTKVFKSNA